MSADMKSLSEQELKERIAEGERIFDNIDKLDPARVIREGKAEETLARLDGALSTMKDARDELKARAARRGGVLPRSSRRTLHTCTSVANCLIVRSRTLPPRHSSSLPAGSTPGNSRAAPLTRVASPKMSQPRSSS